MESLSSAGKQAVVISVNPKSGASDRAALVEQAAKSLADAGFEVALLTEIEEVVDQANRWLQQNRLRAVVAAGGDGTVALLANRLPPEVTLAIFPLGTENLLAKHLGLTASIAGLVELLKSGNSRLLDAGRANGKLFLVTASCGFDADVVQRLHRSRTGHINHFSYVRPIIASIWRYRFPELTVVVDDGEQEPVRGRWLFLFNIPRYAMNLPFSQDADDADGKIDLCSFKNGGVFRGLYYLAAVVFGKHRRWCKTEFRKFRKISVTSNQPVRYQLDGDPGGETPLEIEVIPKYLTVLVPAKQSSQSIANKN